MAVRKMQSSAMAAATPTRTSSSSNAAQTTATRPYTSHGTSSGNRQPSSLRQSTSRTHKTRATLPTSPENGAMCVLARSCHASPRLAAVRQLTSPLPSLPRSVGVCVASDEARLHVSQGPQQAPPAPAGQPDRGHPPDPHERVPRMPRGPRAPASLVYCRSHGLRQRPHPAPFPERGRNKLA